jgi:hypothetical protein
MMSSPFTPWLNLTIAGAICIVLAVVAGLVAILFLRRLTNRLIRPAASQARTAQWREQQSRAMAEKLYGAGSGFVWAVVIVTALAEFGVNVLPAMIVIGAAIVALGIGAHSFVADVVAGLAIIFEDQYAIGDTIQVGAATGKVEQFTLRRTVLRDVRGALVTLANGTVLGAGNLSRDWSQAFVDISGQCAAIHRGRKRSWMDRACWVCRIMDVLGRRCEFRCGPRRCGRTKLRANCDAGFNWSFSGITSRSRPQTTWKALSSRCRKKIQVRRFPGRRGRWLR